MKKNSLTAYLDHSRLIKIGEDQHFRNCSLCERPLDHWRIETEKVTNYSTNVNNIELSLCNVKFFISLAIIMNYVSNMETIQRTIKTSLTPLWIGVSYWTGNMNLIIQTCQPFFIRKINVIGLRWLTSKRHRHKISISISQSVQGTYYCYKTLVRVNDIIVWSRVKTTKFCTLFTPNLCVKGV